MLDHDPYKPIFISFSGGRTSAFLVHYIMNNPKYRDNPKIILFANTGKEREETLQFVNECDQRWNLDVIWVEANINPKKGKGGGFTITNFQDASRNGEPFEAVIRKFGISNKMFPHCSRELKERPLHKCVKSLGYKDYYTAIGIRADEKLRIDLKSMRAGKKIYPLAVEFKVDKNFIRRWWDSQSFDLQLKDYEGNCDLCWKKSKRKKLTIIKENPGVTDWWVKMENKYGGDDNVVFHRENESTEDLILQSKKDIWMAQDEWEVSKMQTSAFDSEMDTEYSCFCKST